MSLYGNQSGGTPLGVDMNGVDEYEGYDDSPLPDGDYSVFVDKAELRMSSYSGNKYLSVVYKVEDGNRFRGRVIFDTFAMWGNNSMVAKSRFKSLRRNLGLNPNTSGTVEELLGRQCTVTVKARARRDDSSKKETRVTAYKSVASSANPAPVMGARPAAPMQAAPQAAASDYPW